MGEPKVFLILIWLTRQTTSGSKERLICDFSRGEENAWWAFSLAPRACLKNAFSKMCGAICGRFCLNEGGVAGYVN